MFTKTENQFKNCRYCEDKFGFGPHSKFWGNKNSKIVQISPTPFNNIRHSSKPFTDKSGNTLKHDWYRIHDDQFYNDGNFYVGTLPNCYPGRDSSVRPSKCDYDKLVKKELDFLNNDMFVIIGSRTAKAFFPNERFEDLVFNNRTLNGKPAIVLPHPSPMNNRWLNDHPDFMKKRIVEVRKMLKDALLQ